MTPHSALSKRVHPARRHLIAPDASLAADLGLCSVDLVSVACDLEEAHGFMFPGEPETRWQTVADVVADFEAMAGVVA